jgi:hypothetical protein
VQSLECSPLLFSEVNTCDALGKHFSCVKCEESYGLEQPVGPWGIIGARDLEAQGRMGCREPHHKA